MKMKMTGSLRDEEQGRITSHLKFCLARHSGQIQPKKIIIKKIKMIGHRVKIMQQDSRFNISLL